MNNEQHRKMLLSQFHDLVAILHRKNLGNEVPNDEELSKMSDVDLSEWIKQLKDVSRTPSD